MNPYETQPDQIPSLDRYSDIPNYGRYRPQPTDFKVEEQHINCYTPESIKYWESVLEQCDESVQIYPADDDGRDVFALGSVIIKSGHLHKPEEAGVVEIDYTYADTNECEAISMARSLLEGVRVPWIYFSGKVSSNSRIRA
jgi:hypothetical protein